MQYFGGKAKLIKYLKPILLEYARKDRQDRIFIDLFTGGANIVANLPELPNKIANDNNPYLIAMYQALQLGWLPPKNFTEKQYIHIKNNKEIYPPELVGFIGCACSFSGTWFTGYAKESSGKRNYCLAGYNSLVKKLPFLRQINFQCNDYNSFVIPNNSIIYCDPPYENTSSRYYCKNFNHDNFYKWCSNQAKNNIVLLSSYTAPFECIWQKETFTYTRDKVNNKRIEKLFLCK